jgi:hypothetical protein
MDGALERWHDFFLLVGTAGATLLALLFVAVSIGTGFLTEARAAPTRAFYSPVVVHFSAIFFVAAVGLVPGLGTTPFALVIGVCAVFGFAVSAFTVVQLLRNKWTNYVRDHVAYGSLPALCYVALFGTAVLVLRDTRHALDVLAAALLLLMLVNIRNAWDLMLSMVRHQAEHKDR